MNTNHDSASKSTDARAFTMRADTSVKSPALRLKLLFLRASAVLFSFILLFILLITSFEAVCYWTPDLYTKEFAKHNVQNELRYWRGEEMSMESLEDLMHHTMAYLRGDRENLIVEEEISGKRVEFYNADEKSHMADVRVIFVRSIFLRAIGILTCLAIAAAGIVLAGLRQELGILGRGYLRVCLFMLMLAALIGLWAARDFTGFFTRFHEVFFSQGNWMFDPRESRMICVMPEGFFSDIAGRWLGTFLGSIVVLAVPAALLRRGIRSKKPASGRKPA